MGRRHDCVVWWHMEIKIVKGSPWKFKQNWTSDLANFFHPLSDHAFCRFFMFFTKKIEFDVKWIRNASCIFFGLWRPIPKNLEHAFLLIWRQISMFLCEKMQNLQNSSQERGMKKGSYSRSDVHQSFKGVCIDHLFQPSSLLSPQTTQSYQ